MNCKKLNEDILIEVLSMYPGGVTEEKCIEEYGKRLGVSRFATLRAYFTTIRHLQVVGKIIVTPSGDIKLKED